VGYSSIRRRRQPEMWVFTITRRTYVSSAAWSSIRSQDWYALTSVACNRSSASARFPVIAWAARSRAWLRERTYSPNATWSPTLMGPQLKNRKLLRVISWLRYASLSNWHHSVPLGTSVRSHT
jgi:hypothetical protein